MPRHTPAPWTVHTNGLGLLHIEGACGRCVYDSGQPEPRPMAQADARLIASAPTLLAALDHIATSDERGPDEEDTPAYLRSLARAAIRSLK